MTTEIALTPLMRQYFDIKNQFIDALVFFQVGDFYELFFADAQKASTFLGIVLTQRGTMNNEPIPLCGVPRHTAEHYIVKLIKGGFRVVLCDQLEAPQPGKIVERGVTHVFTPGTLIDAKMLDSKSSQYLCALSYSDGMVGIAFYEILTSSLYVTECTYDEKKMDAELGAFMPQEILIADGASGKKLEQWCRQKMLPITRVQEQGIQSEIDRWFASFNRLTDAPLTPAQHAVLHILGMYIKKHAPHSYDVAKKLLCYQAHDYLQLDAATQKNLELVVNSYDGSSHHSVLSVLDDAVTGMGSRLLKKWLLRPLIDRGALEKRLDRVEFFVTHSFARSDVRAILKKIGDLERIVGRLAIRRGQLSDYRALHESLAEIPLLQQYSVVDFSLLAQVHTLLTKALNRDDQQQQWKIAAGYHDELDRLRMLASEGMQAIFELERKEQQKSGINTLKIRYSQSAGYAIEVTKAHADAVPPSYMKVQSLTNRERFTTQELKDLEYDIQRAEKSSIELENQLFDDLMRAIDPYVALLQRVASDCAELDLFTTLAHVSINNRWIRPELHDTGSIIIKEGRHPIVEARMRVQSEGKTFIPNTTELRYDKRTWIITGPNMGGKSTYLRQNALICILAQMGSFVPASYASVPLLDRIFTRIGAGDYLAEGKSTFLVEMEETALICKNATHKSLVILDEVGRGTSTYDGLALAQAIVEYVHVTTQALCLFATHYHELTQLSSYLPGVVCYHAASKPVGDSVILLHKIVPGVAQGSFGIQVAMAAQIPPSIIARARVLLEHYSEQSRSSLIIDAQNVGVLAARSEEKALDRRAAAMQALIDGIDLDTISPRQAFELLSTLKECS